MGDKTRKGLYRPYPMYIYIKERQGSFWRPDVCGRGETWRSVQTRHFMYYVWTKRMTMDMADQVWCCGDDTKVVKAKRLCVKSSISRPIKRKEAWEGEVLMMRLLTFAARENCDAICVYTPAVEGLTERQRPSAFTRWPRSKDCLRVHSGLWMVNRGWVQSAFTLRTLKAVIIVFTSRRKRRRKQKNGMTKKKWQVREWNKMIHQIKPHTSVLHSIIYELDHVLQLLYLY